MIEVLSRTASWKSSLPWPARLSLSFRTLAAALSVLDTQMDASSVGDVLLLVADVHRKTRFCLARSRARPACRGPSIPTHLENLVYWASATGHAVGGSLGRLMGTHAYRIPLTASDCGKASFGRALRPLLGFLIVMALATSGCAGRSTASREQAFSDLFPVEDANSSLSLMPLDGLTGTDFDAALSFQLENHSSRVILFPPGFGVRGFVFTEQSQEWTEIPNAVEFPEVQMVLGPRGGNLPHIDVVDYKPGTELPGGSAGMRVVVVGTQLNEDMTSGDSVLAYIDVTLEP